MIRPPVSFSTFTVDDRNDVMETIMVNSFAGAQDFGRPKFEFALGVMIPSIHGICVARCSCGEVGVEHDTGKMGLNALAPSQYFDS